MLTAGPGRMLRAGGADKSVWVVGSGKQWLFWEGESCCGAITLHTHPVGVHYELQDIAGVSGQGAHSCAWDQLTVVLEEYHKQGLFVMGKCAMAGPNPVQAHGSFDRTGDHQAMSSHPWPTSPPGRWLCTAAGTW